MTAQQRDMIKRAQQTYPGQRIRPCESVGEFSKCFTEYNGRVFFWFDTPDGSTHLVVEEK